MGKIDVDNASFKTKALKDQINNKLHKLRIRIIFCLRFLAVVIDNIGGQKPPPHHHRTGRFVEQLPTVCQETCRSVVEVIFVLTL